MKTAQPMTLGFTSRTLARCVPFLASAAFVAAVFQSTAAYSQTFSGPSRTELAAPTPVTQTSTSTTSTTSGTTSQYSVTAPVGQTTNVAPLSLDTSSTTTSIRASTLSGSTTQSTLTPQQQRRAAATLTTANRRVEGGRPNMMWNNH